MVPVNYWAVLVAGIVNMILGGLWYGPLLGKPWSRIMGWSDADMAAMKADPKGRRMMMRSYAIMLVGSLVMSFVMAHFVIFTSAYLMIYGIWAGLTVGVLAWLGFLAFSTMSPVLWEKKPWKLWFINSGYYLVGLVLMGLILAVWQ